MRQLSEREIGYIAGLIDGEGCFAYGGRSINVSAKVDIVMSDERVIRWLAEEVFGVAFHKQKKTDKPHHKPTYHITLCAGTLRDLLPLIVSSLIVKEEQAMLMMEFLSLFGDGKRPFKELAYKGMEIKQLFHKYNKVLNDRTSSKRGEFRGTLDKKAILSQALKEISVKVQRLRDEAKYVSLGKGLDLIHDSGKITKCKLSNTLGSKHRSEFYKEEGLLLSAGIVDKIKEGNTTYYVYADNSRMSAADARSVHQEIV